MHIDSIHKHTYIFQKLWNIVRPNQDWKVKTCLSNSPDLGNLAKSEDGRQDGHSHLIFFYKPGQPAVLMVNDNPTGKHLTVQGLQGKTASVFQTTQTQDMKAAIMKATFSRGKFTFTLPAECIVILATK